MILHKNPLLAKYPALKALIFFTPGIIIGLQAGGPSSGSLWLMASIALILLLALFLYRGYTRQVILGILLIISGYLSSAIHDPYRFSDDASDMFGNEMTIRGIVTGSGGSAPGWVEIDALGEIPEQGSMDNLPIKTRIYLPPENKGASYGDSIEVRGVLRLPPARRNPGGFDMRGYLSLRRVNSVIFSNELNELTILSSGHGNRLKSNILIPLRKGIADRFDELLTHPSSSLLKALVLGDRDDLPRGTIESFREAGIVHVLAISGLHVGYVIIIIYFLTSPLAGRNRLRTALIILGILFYVLLVGWRAPVVRASIMAGALVFGEMIERRHFALNSIAFSALIILLISPIEIMSPGFHLSFAAVASIAFFTDRFRGRIPSPPPTSLLKKGTRWLVALTFVSIAAQIGTVPIAAYHFHTFPPVALLGSVIAIPIAGLILILGICTISFSYIWFFLGNIYAAGLDMLASGFLTFVNNISERADLSMTVGHFPGWMLIFYTVAVIGIGFMNIKNGKKVAVIGILLFLNVLIWSRVIHERDMTIAFLDVGQGDAAFVQLPNGENILIDAGSQMFGAKSGKWAISPFLKYMGVEKINRLIISHGHEDHYGGADYLLRHLSIDTLITAHSINGSDRFIKIIALADSLEIYRKTVQAGDVIILGPYSIGYFLHPSGAFFNRYRNNVNDNSVVFLLRYGKNKILFSGDIEKKGELALLPYAEFLDIDVLKVPHHGSSDSNIEDFIRLTTPERAVISVGKNNRFGHPSESVIERYSQSGAAVYRTDLKGSLIMVSDGLRIREVRWKD